MAFEVECPNCSTVVDVISPTIGGAELRDTNNDLAVALQEVRRLRAGIEHIACSGWPDSLQRYVDNLLAPVDLT